MPKDTSTIAEQAEWLFAQFGKCPECLAAFGRLNALKDIERAFDLVAQTMPPPEKMRFWTNNNSRDEPWFDTEADA